MQKIVAAVVLSAAVLRAEPSRIPHGTVDLVPAVGSIRPGAALQVGLLFRLEPGWHIYWKNPGDSGQPPRLKWELPAGLTAGEIEWPSPKLLSGGTATWTTAMKVKCYCRLRLRRPPRGTGEFISKLERKFTGAGMP